MVAKILNPFLFSVAVIPYFFPDIGNNIKCIVSVICIFVGLVYNLALTTIKNKELQRESDKLKNEIATITKKNEDLKKELSGLTHYFKSLGTKFEINSNKFTRSTFDQLFEVYKYVSNFLIERK